MVQTELTCSRWVLAEALHLPAILRDKKTKTTMMYLSFRVFAVSTRTAKPQF